MSHYVVRMLQIPDIQQANILRLLGADMEHGTVTVQPIDDGFIVHMQLTAIQIERLKAESWVAEVMHGSNLAEVKATLEFQRRVSDILEKGLSHRERISTVNVPEDIVFEGRNRLRRRFRPYSGKKFLSVFPNFLGR